jgi:tRNA nucleotidyltransferase (CCA-adding enzyme)
VTGSDRLDFTFLGDELLADLRRICLLVQAAGGRAWLVGGSVRDAASGRAPVDLGPPDLDLEVFGLAPETLQEVLAAEFALDLVGQAFGIIKLKGLPIEVGLPRRETKIGQGHRGFAIHADPELPLAAAAARRDFTINAVYFDPLSAEVQDPFAGLDDLRAGVLRHTSAAFSEDPLRVLRAMQLTARFDLTVDPLTVQLCRSIGTEELVCERVFGEWSKLITLGERPAKGLAFLQACGWIYHYPELAALVGCPQDPRWHPEGDAWIHTLHCLDAFAAEKTGDHWEDLVVGLAVLCHDFGKPTTTTEEKGSIRALGHDAAGARLTRRFLERLTGQRKLIHEIVVLVAEHMRPVALYEAQASDAAVRRLAARVGRIDRLVRVARADAFGRPPLPDDSFTAGDWLLEKARRLNVVANVPEPLVKGRHLIELGQAPGPSFSAILAECFEAQLAGRFTTVEMGIAFARDCLERR